VSAQLYGMKEYDVNIFVGDKSFSIERGKV
jgi:hypothetical protein